MSVFDYIIAPFAVVGIFAIAAAILIYREWQKYAPKEECDHQTDLTALDNYLALPTAITGSATTLLAWLTTRTHWRRSRLHSDKGRQ